MGVLYSLSIPSQCNVYHDSFSIIDDRSCVSSCKNRHSTYFSGTVSELYHSFLFVICRVGHVDSTSHQWPLQGIKDPVKTLGQSKKTEEKNNGLLEGPGQSILRRRFVSCGAETRKPDFPTTIHRSRHGSENQLDELAPGDAGAVDGKPLPKLASLGDHHPAIQANPGEESINNESFAESRQEERKLSAGVLEDNINAADVPLPLSPPLLPLNDHPKGRKQVLPCVAGRLEKRQRDDNHEDVTQFPVRFKKVMSRSQKVLAPSVYVQQPDAITLLSAVPVKPRDSLPRFEVARKDRAMDVY